jgi:hypothetical protein
MNPNDINDKRMPKDFKGVTFSNFKKSAAKKELLNHLYLGKIEESCYWSGEFICAGHFLGLWDILFLFVCKNIHLGNPKLPTYMDLRFNDFKNIVTNGYIDNELKMRNNNKIRRLFCEVICVLCLSNKKSSFDIPKIKEAEFMATNISYKLNADNVRYAQTVFRKEDPNELFIAINELAWNISDKSKNTVNAYYWIEWILGYEKKLKQNGKKIMAASRNYTVENKYKTDIIWLIWNIIQQESLKKSKAVEKIIDSLINLFCIRYQPGYKQRRKSIIYFAVALLTEPFEKKIPLLNNKKIIEKVTSKIDVIYKQIKKNEVTPDTDYLFKGFNSGNLEKTISKLEKMSSLTNMVPRNK